MKINFKKNGGGYISGCAIAFGSKEMKELNLIDEKGDLKEIKDVKNDGENTLIINFKKNKKST